ncbi:alpha/beta hydrolase [Halostagnicola sp. A-GB9-2]|uniref:alpha/beta fold hydrolase n=1 Tax=Halostagnicola sp. A-GB9-2 TaxID=3048066 RepID=UPI0024BF617F|nr:alpha/beta hydrolase [Halostagnicola sp. A-GB9-2]MDJ1431224.1 alpha/beta hydrolase [Halostagnicola sp. A-GB9-2]
MVDTEIQAAVPDGWTDDNLEVGGVRLHYYRSGGEGRPLVVAHGITSDGRSRLPLFEPLATEYDVIAYDARGHGRSAAPETGYRYDELASDLLGVIEALGIANESPLLYGHSMGGTTVAVAAAAEPDVPGGVVLEDPELLLEPAGGERENGGDETGNDENRNEREPNDDLLTPIVDRITGDRDRTEALETDPELRALAADGRGDLATLLADAYANVDPAVGGMLEAGGQDPAEVFAEIDAPTLVLKADAADAVRKRHREISSRLGDGRLVHVEGAGHCVLRDEYDRALEELQAFLEQQ